MSYLKLARQGLFIGISVAILAHAGPTVAPRADSEALDLSRHQVAVVAADYPLIRQDFPETRDLTPEQIDAWLIQRATRYSRQQAQFGHAAPPLPAQYLQQFQRDFEEYKRGPGTHHFVAPPLPKDHPYAEKLNAPGNEHARTYFMHQVTAQGNVQSVNERLYTAPGSVNVETTRPKDYGRGMVLGIQGPDGQRRSMESKGSGGEHPAKGNATNGLLSLEEAVSEFVTEKNIDAAIQVDPGLKQFSTVKSYAVLATDVVVQDDYGHESFSGLYLRQHFDREGDEMSYRLVEAFSTALEKYGISPHFNVQRAAGGRIVDFGDYRTSAQPNGFADSFAPVTMPLSPEFDADITVVPPTAAEDYVRHAGYMYRIRERLLTGKFSDVKRYIHEELLNKPRQKLNELNGGALPPLEASRFGGNEDFLSRKTLSSPIPEPKLKSGMDCLRDMLRRL